VKVTFDINKTPDSRTVPSPSCSAYLNHVVIKAASASIRHQEGSLLGRSFSGNNVIFLVGYHVYNTTMRGGLSLTHADNSFSFLSTTTLYSWFGSTLGS